MGFFDEPNALERLSILGDKLEWLDKVIDWRIFIPILEKAKPDRTKTRKGGRPPLSPLMMFKVIILQELYGVANDATEFMISDRLSWRRFLGMSLSDRAPDGSTIWAFREALMNSGAYDDLLMLFNAKMVELGIITRRGSIVDASFVDAPRQRNTREENKVIKEGGIPEVWEEEGHEAMLAQKDLDATWTKKGEEVHFGYKDHVICDADSKMIVDYRVTPAHVHDSQMITALVGNYDTGGLWADSAYRSNDIDAWFTLHRPEIRLHISERGYRGTPLTDSQKASNREKSRIRSRIEHIFGFMSGSMGGMNIRCIGIQRAECAVVLKNLAYNISRYAILRKLAAAPSMV
jgi:IS5 family transposase